MGPLLKWVYPDVKTIQRCPEKKLDQVNVHLYDLVFPPILWLSGVSQGQHTPDPCPHLHWPPGENKNNRCPGTRKPPRTFPHSEVCACIKTKIQKEKTKNAKRRLCVLKVRNSYLHHSEKFVL